MKQIKFLLNIANDERTFEAFELNKKYIQYNYKVLNEQKRQIDLEEVNSLTNKDILFNKFEVKGRKGKHNFTKLVCEDLGIAKLLSKNISQYALIKITKPFTIYNEIKFTNKIGNCGYIEYKVVDFIENKNIINIFKGLQGTLITSGETLTKINELYTR